MKSPTKRDRKRAVILMLVIAVLGSIAYLSVDRYLDGINTRLHQEDPELVAHQLGATLRLVAVGLALLVLILAGWLFRLARLVSKSGQFPPPGARVIYETPVLTGAAARHKAYTGYALAAIVFFAGMAATILLWRVTASLLAL